MKVARESTKGAGSIMQSPRVQKEFKEGLLSAMSGKSAKRRFFMYRRMYISA